ncbi:MAG: hypothetical protein QF718_05830 [Phycisphaerales bacterium]|jgi:hypothetical protein|nr:hypothetical protein [Phycisphaerales bacterium]
MTTPIEQNNHDITKPIAWTISVGVHLGVGAIAFLITWQVIRTEDEPPRVVTAIWHEQPVAEQSNIPVKLEPKEVELIVTDLSSEPIQVDPIKDGIAILNQIKTTGTTPKEAMREPEMEVEFMGLDAFAAKKIIYVVDASGSMLLHLSTVLDELERSLRTLHPKQEFGIIFFQQDKSIVVPPKNKLLSAKEKNIVSAMKWINTSGKVIPVGGSNPIKAMKSAIRLKPDVIYLLSENITGAGKYEVPADELIESLDKINPIDPRNGLRRVQINCIEYLTLNPARTMQRIAEIHGGDDGYTFIERGRVEQ